MLFDSIPELRIEIENMNEWIIKGWIFFYLYVYVMPLLLLLFEETLIVYYKGMVEIEEVLNVKFAMRKVQFCMC